MLREGKGSPEDPQTLARYAAVVAELGQKAMQQADLASLLSETTFVVTRVTGALCSVWELLPDRERLLLRSGAGPLEVLAGYTTIQVDPQTVVGYSVLSGAPVLVQDLRVETALGRYPFPLVPEVVSCLCAVIPGRERPLGVISVHSAAERRFTAQEVYLLQSVANVLSAAIERQRLEEEQARLLTMERAARSAAEGARRRLGFLAEASKVMEETLDYDKLLGEIARLAVPFLADGCVVHTLENDVPSVVAVAHVEPAREALLRELGQRYAPRGVDPLLQVLKTGNPAMASELTERVLAVLAQDEQHLQFLRELGLGSYMILPLVARGRTLGAVTLLAAASGRRYAWSDLALAQDYAARCALALDNARLYREAQEALRARQELLAGITHDLKTPLTVIKGWAQVFSERAQQSPSLALESRGLEDIVGAVNEMVQLIDQLLRFSQMEAGQELELELEEVDLVALLESVIGTHREMTDRHELVMRVEGTGRVVGWWDASRLREVFSNLLSNAIKYSPAGGTVEVVVRREGDQVRVAVRDQGVGIPREALPRIFEPFYRAPNVLRLVGVQPSLGLGLSWAQHLVRLHGGRIEVESEEGKGSTFTVALPLRTPGATSSRGNSAGTGEPSSVST